MKRSAFFASMLSKAAPKLCWKILSWAEDNKDSLAVAKILGQLSADHCRKFDSPVILGLECTLPRISL